MPGNEKQVAKFLLLNKGKLKLSHVGLVKSVGAPSPSGTGYVELRNAQGIIRYLSSEDSRKKADIYINSHGISVKQLGSSFSYNRLQRANLVEIFELLKFKNTESMLEKLDREVIKFHQGKLQRRNRPWESFFDKSEFKALFKFLVIEGSPNVGFSSHPAEFILEAPPGRITPEDINIYTFDEYFNKYLSKFKIAIRRQWIGQASDSEHRRALGLVKKPGNTPWVFNDVAGVPNMHHSGSRWRKDIPPEERKTVYFLMIEKEA